MTAEQIRKQELSPAPHDDQTVQDCAFFLREIAAQLAELNGSLDNFKSEFTTQGTIDVTVRHP